MPDNEGAFRLSPTGWILAGLCAVAIHVGGAAVAFGYMQADDTEQDLGAPAIEVGVELLAPNLDPTNQPIGPDTAASAPSPAVSAQKAAIDPTQLPKAVPTETDDPERMVSPANTKKPKQNQPKTLTAQADPSQASIAAIATAVPTVKTAVASTRSTAPALGTGDSTQLERVTWEKQLIAHLNKFKRYPADSTTPSAEVVVRFVLDRTGHVLSSEVVNGSRNASFDAAALAMLQHAAPVPPPPPLVADQGLTFTLPVIFQVKPHG